MIAEKVNNRVKNASDEEIPSSEAFAFLHLLYHKIVKKSSLVLKELLCYNRSFRIWKEEGFAMLNLTLQQRKEEIDSLIDSEIIDNDRLVYSFVLNLYSNKEIDECIDYVKKLCALDQDKYSVYYRLWYISLLYLRGYFEKAKQEFFTLRASAISDHIKDFYMKMLGFDVLYEKFITKETEHFVFHIHPNRYANQKNINFKIERCELGYELVGKGFFGIVLERKIHYFLWDNNEMRDYFNNSQTCSCYGVIQEGEYNRDWHESTHVYNYLYGMERPKSFVMEGIAVYNDGRKGSVRLKYAQAAYQKSGVSPSIREWWQDTDAFRKTNSWITYTTAGYFILKLRKKFGKEKLLQLAKYQTFEDACRIYGEAELLFVMHETEEDIINSNQ